MLSGTPGVNPILGTISIFTNYSFSNSYFSGPTHYETGIKLVISGVSGIEYLFNDLFANIPFLSKYFFPSKYCLYL